MRQVCGILLILLLQLSSMPLCYGETIYETVPVVENRMTAVLRLLEDTASRLGLTYSVFNGVPPEIVLRGEREGVQQMLRLLDECARAEEADELVNISCSLHSLQEGDLLNVGFLPPSGIQASGYYKTGKIWELTLSNLDNSFLKLQQSLDKGNVVIAGDITTPNGLAGELNSKQSLPLAVASGVSGVSSVTYKDVVTDVKITPTVLEYNRELPEESKVRLDIHVKISTVSKTNYGSNSYPYIASREYDITRIVKADGTPYITAAIVRDKELKTTGGIPILKDLPLLKYIFGSEYKRNSREYDIMKVQVNFVPAGKIAGKNAKE